MGNRGDPVSIPAAALSVLGSILYIIYINILMIYINIKLITYINYSFIYGLSFHILEIRGMCQINLCQNYMCLCFVLL